MMQALRIVRLKGKEILPYLSDLANLRITIFKDYPYLYEGHLEYESNYLKTYASCSESIMVVVFDKQTIVGASTAIPLEFETAECKQPFLEKGMNIPDIFYLGESVLLPQYRNQNIYRHFFYERESAAYEYGCHFTAFCAVKRPQDDPKQPKNYRSLDKIWEHFGYQKHPELCAYFEWKEVGEKSASKKPLIFWLKKL